MGEIMSMVQTASKNINVVHDLECRNARLSSMGNPDMYLFNTASEHFWLCTWNAELNGAPGYIPLQQPNISDYVHGMQSTSVPMSVPNSLCLFGHWRRSSVHQIELFFGWRVQRVYFISL